MDPKMVALTPNAMSCVTKVALTAHHTASAAPGVNQLTA